MTPREEQILHFMQAFGGRTYENVLNKTFFESKNTTQKSIDRLVKHSILRREKTGLLSPKSALVFGADVFDSAIELFGEKAKHSQISISSIKHFMLEQVAYYWLSYIGEVKRASVKQYSLIYIHTPDLILTTADNKLMFIELEITIKSQQRYKEIVGQLSRINELFAVIYVLNNEKDVLKLASIMPKFAKLYFISIDELISNIKSSSKIGAKSQQSIINSNKEALGGLFVSN